MQLSWVLKPINYHVIINGFPSLLFGCSGMWTETTPDYIQENKYDYPHHRYNIQFTQVCLLLFCLTIAISNYIIIWLIRYGIHGANGAVACLATALHVHHCSVIISNSFLNMFFGCSGMCAETMPDSIQDNRCDSHGHINMLIAFLSHHCY